MTTQFIEKYTSWVIDSLCTDNIYKYLKSQLRELDQILKPKMTINIDNCLALLTNSELDINYKNELKNWIIFSFTEDYLKIKNHLCNYLFNVDNEFIITNESMNQQKRIKNLDKHIYLLIPEELYQLFIQKYSHKIEHINPFFYNDEINYKEEQINFYGKIGYKIYKEETEPVIEKYLMLQMI